MNKYTSLVTFYEDLLHFLVRVSYSYCLTKSKRGEQRYQLLCFPLDYVVAKNIISVRPSSLSAAVADSR
jgi:hypothetical protein